MILLLEVLTLYTILINKHTGTIEKIIIAIQLQKIFNITLMVDI